MHTPLRIPVPSDSQPRVGAEVRWGVWCAALLVLLLAVAGPARGQASFPGVPDGRSFNLRVYPTDVWGHRVGPGVGLGVVGHNLLRPDDQWLLTAAPARHEQVATLSVASANPYRARRFVLVDGRALHTDRDWLGPPSRRLTLRRSSITGRLRVGQTALDRHLLVQPRLTLRSHHVDAVRVPTLLPEGLAGLASSIPSPPQTRTGIRIGLDLQYDTPGTMAPFAPGLRLRAGGHRYVPLNGSDLRFDQFDASVEAVMALGGSHRLVAHTEVTLTRPRTSSSVPIFMLPTLGASGIPGWARGRVVDRDRVLGSLLYRFPIWTFGRVATLEGHVGGHLANVYRDVGEEFRPRIRREAPPPDERGRPLRPSASVGLRLDVPIRPVSAIDLAVGIGPDGISAAQFSLSRSLRALRPPHHVSDNLLF